MIDYIKDHYGHCKTYDPKIKDSCSCLKEGWLGRLCPNWVPIEENSFEEMIEKMKERKNARH